jgi:thymidylate kinase
MKGKNHKLDDLPYKKKGLTELTRAGLNYALIREPKGWDGSGDIDILVGEIQSTHEVLLELKYIPIEKNDHNAKYLKYDEQHDQWVHLDVQSDIRLNSFATPMTLTESLLETKKLSGEDIWRINHDCEMIITIFHAAVNKEEFDKVYRKRIFETDLLKLKQYNELFSFLPIPLNEYIDLLIKVQNGKTDEKHALKYIQDSFGNMDIPKRSFIKRIKRRLMSIFSRDRAIVFLGPDGSGKSTIISSLVKIQWPMTRSQYMGPSRYEDMARPFEFLMKRLLSLSNRYSKKHTIGAFSRIGWNIVCYFDFIERFYRHVWFMGSGGLVLIDRYACDMYFRKSTLWNEILFLKLFPKPRFVYLCAGDAHKIYQRKPEELRIKDIENVIMLYRQKFTHYNIQYLELNTTEYSLSKILELIVKTNKCLT